MVCAAHCDTTLPELQAEAWASLQWESGLVVLRPGRDVLALGGAGVCQKSSVRCSACGRRRVRQAE